MIFANAARLLKNVRSPVYNSDIALALRSNSISILIDFEIALKKIPLITVSEALVIVACENNAISVLLITACSSKVQYSLIRERREEYGKRFFDENKTNHQMMRIFRVYINIYYGLIAVISYVHYMILLSSKQDLLSIESWSSISDQPSHIKLYVFFLNK